MFVAFSCSLLGCMTEKSSSICFELQVGSSVVYKCGGECKGEPTVSRCLYLPVFDTLTKKFLSLDTPSVFSENGKLF